MSDSHVTISAHATSFVGPDATNLFRALTLKQGIAMHRKFGMIPTRGATITRMLAMASEYSGKPYKRGQHAQAEADLQAWIDAMKCALPINRTA